MTDNILDRFITAGAQRALETVMETTSARMNHATALEKSADQAVANAEAEAKSILETATDLAAKVEAEVKAQRHDADVALADADKRLSAITLALQTKAAELARIERRISAANAKIKTMLDPAAT